MAIDSINFKNVNSIAPKKEVKEKEAPKTKEEIKDGKKKLALMATGAAAVAVAGIAIAMKIKGEKPIDGKTIAQASEAAQDVAQNVAENASKKAQDVAQDVAQKATSELPNEAKTFDDVIKLLPNPEDIKAGKGYIKNMDSTNPFKYNGFAFEIPTPKKLIDQNFYPDIQYRDSGEHAGKFIMSKTFYTKDGISRFVTILYDPKTGKKTISHPKEPRAMYVRKTIDGITTVNGKEKAKRTIEALKDGTKKISVDYYDGNPKPFCRKVITIAPDGKKTREMLAKT